MVGIIIWYELLNHVNKVRKILQNFKIDISMTTLHLNELLKYSNEFRNTGFISSIITAGKLVNEPKFRKKRTTKKKTQFNYESLDSPITRCPRTVSYQLFLKNN